MENKPIILVVDDQPDFVEGIRLILEEEDYMVWTAGNGQQGLERLQAAYVDHGEEHLPHLILSDIMMPVMDGYTFYEHVRNDPHFQHIPFIFFTAKTDGSDIERGRILGVEDYLTKPCNPEVVLSSVRGQLKRGPRPKVTTQEESYSQIGTYAIAAAVLLVVIILTIALTVMFMSPAG